MGLTKRDFLIAGACAAMLSGAAISGCTQTTEAPTSAASVSAEAVPPPAPAGNMAAGAGTNNPGTMPEPPGPASAKDAPPMMGGGNAPFAGGKGGDPNAPLSASPELDKKIVDAEKSKDKKAISAAYTERGAARMYDEKAGQRTKYRAALEDFRKALAADPTNKDAKASKDTIESIYTSMGRPIPK